MAYEVTATRRRPQRFEDLAGQEFVAATLKNAIQTDKIAHAYLFSGPRGCGKTSAARILAKALNCEKGPSPVPCGECSACQEITRGSSMDVIEIDGASNTSVNDVRQIKDEVLFPPNSYRYKVYIIDEVHMLSTNAFNALLKTIEEPPPYVIFIFATTELHKVPATIKSRCQQFNFRLVAIEQIKELLAAACAEADIQAEDEALFWIARESTGSVRDAYTLFDQVAAFSDGQITFEKIREKLGLTSIDQLNSLCEACADKNAGAAMDILDGIIQSGVSIEQFITSFTDYFRNLLLIQSGIRRESLLGQAPEHFSALVLKKWQLVQIERGLSILLQLYRDIRYSLEPRFELELAVSRLAWLSDYVSASEVKQAIEQAKTLLAGRSSVLPAKPSPGEARPDTRRRDTGPFDHNGQAGSGGFAVPPSGDHTEESTPAGNEFFAAMKKSLGIKPETPVPVPVVPEAHTKMEDPVVDNSTAIQVPAARIPADSGNNPQVSGGLLSLEQLRNTLIQEIGESKTMVAAALAQTGSWSYTGTVIHTTIEKPFVRDQLLQESHAINEMLSRLWGKETVLEVTFTEHHEAAVSKPAAVPKEVELLCKVFKGTAI